MLKGAALALCALVLCTAPPARAQQFGVVQSEILTVSTERLFVDSLFGQRIAREIEEESAVLAAENRRIEAELTAEERALTERRETMPPQEFRALADEFDTRVQEFRSAQDAKTRALGQRREEARAAFIEAIIPILAGVMQETGASVILERSTVFLSTNATDVTELALQRVNAAIGDGSDLPDAPPQ